jgi:molybdate transport repressor ModE-like protein
MDRLRCMEVFIEVARTGSFAASARNLGMSRAAVTKHVARLEDLLGARLLNRTTKQVGLTEAGLMASAGGRQLLERYDTIEADVRDSTRTPRGVVRVGTPPAFGTYHMVPLVAAFAERHPDIHVAQPLAKAPQLLVASPDYLARHGTPRTLADLGSHNCLVHVIKSPTGIWRFAGPQGPASVRVRGTIASNFGDALMHAALRGYGISMHPYYMVSQSLDEGRLVAVLPEYAPDAHDVHVIYSSRQNLPERVRRFIAFLRDWARTPPLWSVPRPAAAPAAVPSPPPARRRPPSARRVGST